MLRSFEMLQYNVGGCESWIKPLFMLSGVLYSKGFSPEAVQEVKTLTISFVYLHLSIFMSLFGFTVLMEKKSLS